MIHHPFIDKVLASQTFANKEVLKGLLKYLFEETRKGNILKEADIALGYFKRGAEFVPGEDTIVRVTVYKLRALLEKYYEAEGKSDAQVIELPKGSYVVSIRARQSVKGDSKRKNWLVISALAALLIVSVVFNIFQLFQRPGPNQDNPVWSSYLKSGQPVFITLGDPFFFRIKDKTSPSGSLIVRDISINSKEDLETENPPKLQEKKSDLSELNYPYFSRNNLWPLPDIISFFAKASVQTRLQTLSESNIDDVKNNNVVFIANINSFRWMNKFLEKTSLKLSNNPRQITVLREKDSLTLSVPEVIKGAYVDYAILVKLPGPNNNEITMMGDFHASGLRGLSHMIGTKSSMEALEKQVVKRVGEFPDHFEMVVKVTSYNYSDFNTELVHFKRL